MIHSKVVKDLQTAIEKVGLRDGMSISFHHHFRNGDYIVNMVLDCIAKMGIKNLKLLASSLTDCHAPLIGHIKNGIVTSIQTSGMRGKLADAVSDGLMDTPVIFRSHGGRAYSIVTGQEKIDVAFLGVPSSDVYGNANGYSRESAPSQCGSMGYARLDARWADKVVLITEHLETFPNTPFAIPQSDVDYIVEVDAIGDPKGIMSGATRFTTDPKEIIIAKMAAKVIEFSGYLQNNFSFQTGTGGASLAVARFMREMMLEKDIKASFALGGITGQIVDLHKEGLVKKILDVQSFDLVAADSLKNNRFHQQIDVAYYAAPLNEGCAVDQLDVSILSAMEADLDFNINVLTGSNGVIRGAVGGHQDSAAGASMTIVTMPLIRGRIPTVLERVNTLVTPGHSIDVIVTERGIAVNPLRQDLLQKLTNAKLPVFTIKRLKEQAEAITGKPNSVKYKDKEVGIVTYRKGERLDTIKQV